MPGPEDEVKMIGHQAIGETPHGDARLGRPDGLQEFPVVSRPVENTEPADTTVQDMEYEAARV